MITHWISRIAQTLLDRPDGIPYYSPGLNNRELMMKLDDFLVALSLEMSNPAFILTEVAAKVEGEMQGGIAMIPY